MDIDQSLFTNDGAPDISTPLPNITSSITEILAPFILLSFVISIIFIVLYITAMIRRRKLENALFDIQKNLTEMNARDKARSEPINPPSPLHTSNEKIAMVERHEEATDQIT